MICNGKLKTSKSYLTGLKSFTSTSLPSQTETSKISVNHVLNTFVKQTASIGENVLEMKKIPDQTKVLTTIQKDEENNDCVKKNEVQEEVSECFECSEMFSDFESFDIHMKSHSVLSLIP